MKNKSHPSSAPTPVFLVELGVLLSLLKRSRHSYGNHMNLGVPSSARLADGLRSVFFNAPVPSGCTFTQVESKLNASILMRTTCSRHSVSHTVFSTPLLDHQ